MVHLYLICILNPEIGFLDDLSSKQLNGFGDCLGLISNDPQCIDGQGKAWAKSEAYTDASADA